MACPGPHICMPSLYSPELWVLLREARIRSVVEAVCVCVGGGWVCVVSTGVCHGPEGVKKKA